ncbi:hypothetical protein VF13_38955, partial [Nostoc linckia z16]
MLKKLLALAIILMLAACGGSSKVYSTKRTTSKSAKKPVTRKRTATAGTGGRNTGSNRSTEVLESTSRTVVYSDLVKQYVLDFKDVAKENMRRHGIPASITLAQG